MLVTKFSRFGQIVKDSDGNVVPGSFRYSFWYLDGKKEKEASFKAARENLIGLNSVQVQEKSFTDKSGKTVEFFVLLNAFADAKAINDLTETVKAINSIDAAILEGF